MLIGKLHEVEKECYLTHYKKKLVTPQRNNLIKFLYSWKYLLAVKYNTI